MVINGHVQLYMAMYSYIWLKLHFGSSCLCSSAFASINPKTRLLSSNHGPLKTMKTMKAMRAGSKVSDSSPLIFDLCRHVLNVTHFFAQRSYEASSRRQHRKGLETPQKIMRRWFLRT